MARNVKGTAKCNELGSIRTHSLGPAVQECAVIHCASRRMMIGVDRLALYTHQGKEGSDSEENLSQHHDIDATTRVESRRRCSHEICLRCIFSRYRATRDVHTLAPCASRWGTFGKQGPSCGDDQDDVDEQRAPTHKAVLSSNASQRI